MSPNPKTLALWAVFALYPVLSACQVEDEPTTTSASMEQPEPTETDEPPIAEPTSETPLPPMEEYDYIVVGGGTAGLTVADRLSESGDFSVLVLEYGTYDNSTSVTTVNQGFQGITNQTHLFSFSSVPQTNLGNRTTTVMLGKLLGGSSAVNGFQVQRGSKANYNNWAKLWGMSETEWGWDDMLSYFVKAWRMQPPDEDVAKELGIKTDGQFWGPSMEMDEEVGEGGVWANFPTMNWPFLKYEMDAFASIPGVTFPSDSGAGETGIFWYPQSSDPHTYLRSHSRSGHWDGIAEERENYDTLTGVKVLSVVLDDDNTATGVTYIPVEATEMTEDNVVTIAAKKEVILAAGTIHTPQILQCSGIGQPEILEEAGIELKVELPGVGMNFQDHPLGGGVSWTWGNFSVHPSPADLQTNRTYMTEVREEFAQNRTGPQTIASGNLATFLPLSVLSEDLAMSVADQLESDEVESYYPSSDPTVLAGYKAQMAVTAASFRDGNIATFNLFLQGGTSESALVDLSPLSRGTVTIDPADPFLSEPLVDYCALCNPLDVDVIVEFTKFTRKYYSLPEFEEFEPEETSPGVDVQTDEDIAEHVRNNVSPSTFHPVGTAPMMPVELGGVVDRDLKVYWTKGLRVVDASVFPMIPGAYTQQTAYAVAEGAALRILADA